MSEPKLLSTNTVEALCDLLLCTGPNGMNRADQLRAHIAALEMERDDAVERATSAERTCDAALADNAALTKRMNDAAAIAAGLPLDGHEGDEESGEHDADCGQCMKDALCAALAVDDGGPRTCWPTSARRWYARGTRGWRWRRNTHGARATRSLGLRFAT